MLVNRAGTEKLREKGLGHLLLLDSMFGLYLFDTRVRKQGIAGYCATAEEAIQQVLDGNAPVMTAGQSMMIIFEGSEVIYITVSISTTLDDVLRLVEEDYNAAIVNYEVLEKPDLTPLCMVAKDVYIVNRHHAGFKRGC